MLRFFKGLFSFKGRVSRGIFWLYHVLLIPIGLLGVILFGHSVSVYREISFTGVILFVLFGWIYRSLFVRRLHDLGRSGTIFKNPFREQKDAFDAYFKKGQPFKNQYDIDQSDQ